MVVCAFFFFVWLLWTSSIAIRLYRKSSTNSTTWSHTDSLVLCYFYWRMPGLLAWFLLDRDVTWSTRNPRKNRQAVFRLSSWAVLLLYELPRRLKLTWKRQRQMPYSERKSLWPSRKVVHRIPMQIENWRTWWSRPRPTQCLLTTSIAQVSIEVETFWCKKCMMKGVLRFDMFSDLLVATLRHAI